MNDIIEAFQVKSKALITEMTAILEEVEAEPNKNTRLQDFGLLVDRIMGGSKTLALQLPKDHPMHVIGNFAEVCKAIGYKAAQVKNSPEFISIVTALLFDAMDVLTNLNFELTQTTGAKIDTHLNATFLDRLRFVATKFDKDLRGTVALESSEHGPGDPLAADLSLMLEKMRGHR